MNALSLSCPSLPSLMSHVTRLLVVLCLWLSALPATVRAGTTTFNGPGSITINDNTTASPYPSTVTVSGIAGAVTAVRVRINQLTHEWLSDVDAFLVSPSGQVCVLFSDAGHYYSAIGVDLVFDDAAGSGVSAVEISDPYLHRRTWRIVSGTYRPSNEDTPIEALPPGASGTIGANLTALAGNGANGDWKLYVSDDSGRYVGSIASWSLEIESKLMETAGSLGTQRYSHTTTLLPNGKLLAVGGVNSTSNTYLASAELYDPATGTWGNTGSLNYARAQHTATLLPNGKVLVVGGYAGSSSLSSTELFDPATGGWTVKRSMSTARRNHTASLLPKGKVLIVGGESSVGNAVATAQIYDPDTDTWSSETNTGGGGRFLHTATLLPNGKVMVAGGLSAGGFKNAKNSVQIYDPAADSWSTASPLAGARGGHTATLLANGKVLVAAGFGSSGPRYNTELYDPGANTWTTGPVFNSAVYGLSASLRPDGSVLLIGGHSDTTGSQSGMGIYDPNTNTIIAPGDFPTTIADHTATVLPDGRVIVVGGMANGGSSLSSVYASAAASGRSDHWTSTGSLSAPRSDNTSTLLPNGKVLTVGGLDASFEVVTAQELYSPATGLWATTGAMNESRSFHTATLLPSGKVLVAGGYGSSGTLASAELYDPTSGTWSSTGSLSTARSQATATLLASGKVLVVGGMDINYRVVGAELYDPATGQWSSAGTMGTNRYYHTATLLPSGKVLVAGGQGPTTPPTSLLGPWEFYDPAMLYLSSMELYDPATNTWASTSPLALGRNFHTATLLPNGKVLLAGGVGSGGSATDTAELYDPVTGSVSPTGSLNSDRHGHSATLLPSGKILLVGGDARSNVSSELYDPAKGTWQNAAVLATEGLSVATITLLPNGKVLLMGDRESAAELYDPGLSFLSAAQPVITSAGLSGASKLVLGGTGFRGVSSASGSGTQDSPSNYPVLQLRALGNEQTRFLTADPTAKFTATSFTSEVLTGFPLGHAMATVFVNGIPSTSAIVNMVSTDATLSGLTLSSGALSPAFASGGTSYTSSVANTTDSLTVSATTSSTTASLTINGTPAVSGIASGSIPLNVGANTITVRVTAQDGTTQQTYTVTVTRSVAPTVSATAIGTITGTAVSINGQVTNDGGAAPTLWGAVISRTSDNPTPRIGGVGVSDLPTTKVSGANFQVGYDQLQPGTSYSFATYATNVSGTGYSSTLTFSTASTNAALANLTLSTGTVSPAFAGATLSYTSLVPLATTSITVTPTAAQANATIKVNNTTVASGSASTGITLGTGTTTITTVVTAQDGVTTRTYTVAVTRSSVPSLTTPTSASIAASTATLGGTVTDDGGSTITARGVVFAPSATTTNPQLGGSGVSSATAAGTTGAFTKAVTGLIAGTPYSFAAYATNSNGTSYSAVGSFTTLSSNAGLDSLTLSSGVVSPAFNSGTLSYTATVGAAVTSITVTPTRSQANATITVNGLPVTSGTPSSSISLNTGANTITTVVTAQDGVTTRTYTVVVTRSSGPIVGSPTSSGIGGTTATLGGNVTSDGGSTITARGVVFAPTATTPNPQIGGLGVSNVISGSGTGVFTTPVSGLSAGVNYTFAAYATNSNGTSYSATGTFTTLSNNANLSNLVLNTAPLSPGFSSATIAYNATVSASTSLLTVTPTAAQAGAVIRVNTIVTTSGSNSLGIGLVPGNNTITVAVTAPDGTTTKTYTITVLRTSMPVVNTPTSSNVTVNSASLGGNLANTGSATITARGVVLARTSANANPQIGGANVSNLILGGTGTTGTFSLSALNLLPGTAYSFAAYATNSNGTSYSSVATFTTLSNNPALSSLAVSVGTLSPVFDSATTLYRVSAGSASSIIVTPTVAQANATLTINDVASASGAASGSIALNPGFNDIMIEVTAQDGVTKRSYSVIVDRTSPPTVVIPVAANLTSSTATLGGTVSNDGSATITARGVVFALTSANANPRIGGLGVTDVPGTGTTGIFTVPVTGLSEGAAYSFAAYATNANGTSYSPTGTFNALRSNANLSSLIVSAGALSPSFNSSVTTYTDTVPNATTSVQVTPFVQDAAATVSVNGVTVASESASGSIALSGAFTPITLVVTAQDGATRTYTVTILKAGTLELASKLYSVTSGASATTADIVINRTNGSNGAVSCNLSTFDGTALAPTHYVAQANTVVNFADLQTVAHVSIPIAPNAATTTGRTFSLIITSATGGATLGTTVTASVAILPASAATETTKPTVTITAPANNASLNDTTSVTITGLAKDNVGVRRVEVSTDNGTTFTEAVLASPGSPSTTYTFPITPVTGTNSIKVKATDFKGNVSTVVSSSFLQLRKLFAGASGTDTLGVGGTVTAGFEPVSSRQVGKTYTITATPFTGVVFTGWTYYAMTGPSASETFPEGQRTITFTMHENWGLTANFVDNPFVAPITGAYNGLVTPTQNGFGDVTYQGNDTVGFLQNAVVTGTGTFTSTLKIDGLSLPVNGSFDTHGVAHFGTAKETTLRLARTNKPTLIVALNLALTGPNRRITGMVQQSRNGNIFAASAIVAEHAFYNGTTVKVAPALAGTKTLPYTMVFPSKPYQITVSETSFYPQGHGFATATVNVNGIVSISGKLADNTGITASASLITGNQWPIFAQLYKMGGSFSGMASLADADANTSDITGTDFVWIRPAQITQWYPDGWDYSITLDVSGARYAVPGTGSVFPGLSGSNPNATLAFSKGLLNAPFSQDLMISALNIATNVPAAASPTLVITKTTGLFTGSFTHTDGTKPAYQGVIIQKGDSAGGWGYFMSTQPKVLNYLGESGAVRVTAK